MSRSIIEIMISCIICSRKPDIPAELKENIASTIGCEYEVVVIDNSKNEYSIFSAYNEGVRRAKGDILCFMHEDILYHTEGWGEKVSKLLEDSTIGLLGVGGAHMLPSAPMYWSATPFISEYFHNSDHGIIDYCIQETYMKNGLADVVVVDGLCMFVRSEMFLRIRFDAESFSDFHAYDIDICMQVQKIGLRVCVSNVLLVEHAWSEMSMRNQSYVNRFEKSLDIFYQKWKDMLPIVRGICLSEDVMTKINNLSIQACDARKVQRSKSYRLGKFLLHPSIKTFKSLIN